MNDKIAKIGNRTIGLLEILVGGVMISGGGLFIPFGTMFAIEGMGDFVSGDHHYVSSRVIYHLSKRKIKIEYPYDRYRK